jgi:hypothetical protein
MAEGVDGRYAAAGAAAGEDPRGAMTAAEARRARWFWWIALLVLPALNPLLVVLVTLVLDGGESIGWVGVALWVVAAGAVALWRLSVGAWAGAERRRRVALAVVAMGLLTVVFGFGEFFLWLLIVCGGGGCFD